MVRDSELYKDKIEVSLDGRQIFYLFFGGAVIVGLVFVLGVMVGRRVEARGHVGHARTTSAVDPLAALDRLEGGNGLSFQGALRGDEPAASAVDKKIDELARARGTGAQARTAMPSHAGAAPRPVPLPDGKASDEADHADHAKHDEAKHDEAKHDEAKHDEAKHDEAKHDEAKHDEAKHDEAKHEAKHDKAKHDEAKHDDKAAKKSDQPEKSDKDGKRYTLQVSSFQDRSEADALLAELRVRGYEPTITSAKVDGKTFYRVRLGTYPSADAANEAKAELERKAQKTASVMRL